MPRILTLLALISLVACRPAPPATSTAGGSSLPLETLSLPEGFEISVWAEGVENARQMCLSPAGVLYVGTRSVGKVHALRDSDGDGRADERWLVAEGLRSPNGVAWRDGSLFVAEIHRILRFDGIDERLDDPPEPIVVRDDYPKEGHHGWKFIRFDAQGRLLVPVGAPCNLCDPGDPFAAITRLSADFSEREILARGVRNTVGFDVHPQTGELWFTDNGRDWLGDDAPDDELNRLAREGSHFGYPYCHAGEVLDPEFGAGRSCEDFVAPVGRLGAHVAALGMRFYSGTSFPAEYRGQVFIAEHGSWNRSEKVGYRVSLVRLSGNEVVSHEPFVEGWLQGQEAWGRPVDVLVLPDGSLLISDDTAHAIYRVSRRG